MPGAPRMSAISSAIAAIATDPSAIKLLYLSKVVHDHVILTTSGLVVGAVSLLLLAMHGASSIAQPGPLRVLVSVATVGNIVVGVGMVAVALSEHLLCRRRSPGWRPASLIGDMFMLLFLPFITIGLAGMPVIHAQAKLLFNASDLRSYTEEG